MKRRFSALFVSVSLAASVHGQSPQITQVTGASLGQYAAPSVNGLVTLFGSGLSNGTQTAASLPLPTELSSTTVDLCWPTDPGAYTPNMSSQCVSAPLLYVSPTQINFYIPHDFDTVGAFVQGGSHISCCFFQVKAPTGTSGDCPRLSVGPGCFVNIAQQRAGVFFIGFDCNYDLLWQQWYAFLGYPSTPCGLNSTGGDVVRGAVTDQQGVPITSLNPMRFGQYYSVYLTGLNFHAFPFTYVGNSSSQPCQETTQTPASFLGVGLNLNGRPTLPPGSIPPSNGFCQVSAPAPGQGSPGLCISIYGIPPTSVSESSYVGLQQLNFYVDPLWFTSRFPFLPSGYQLPCGDYRLDMDLKITGPIPPVLLDTTSSFNQTFQLPLLIRNGDVPCS